MALPHYKLHAPQQALGMDSFPVVMVPNDGPKHTSYLKDLFFSRKTQAIIALVSMAAIATALWVYLEPSNDLFPVNTGNSILISSLAIAAVTLILLTLAAINKFKSRDSFTTLPETISLLAGRETSAATTPSSVESVVEAFENYKRLASEQATSVEFFCEDFASEPFIEFLDEAVIAELFSDEMIAPDCLVFSLEVNENVTQ